MSNSQTTDQAIANAETRGLGDRETRNSMTKSAHYGTIGRHYDFLLSITGIHNWGQDCFVEGNDRTGHKLLFRAANAKDWVGLDTDGVVVVRGRVVAHDKLLGEQITYLETNSAPTRI